MPLGSTLIKNEVSAFAQSCIIYCSMFLQNILVNHCEIIMKAVSINTKCYHIVPKLDMLVGHSTKLIIFCGKCVIFCEFLPLSNHGCTDQCLP